MSSRASAPEPLSALDRSARDLVAAGVHGCVLAAGRGRRMGAAKHLLEIAPGGGSLRSLLEHVVRALRGGGIRHVTVVLRPGDEHGAQLAERTGVRWVFAESATEGRAASVRAAVRSAPDATGWLFALADQPLLRAEDFSRLLEAFAGGTERIIAASYTGQRGTPVLFGAAHRDALLALRGREGGRVVLAAHRDRVVSVALDPARGRDIDTPADLALIAGLDGADSPATMRPQMERTLSIIKPDAVASHKLGAILASIEDAGLRIVALRMLQLTRDQAEQFYAVHKDRPFFGSLCDFMISGPIVVSTLEGEDAIQRYRTLMGATNPSDAEPNTLRALFGSNVERNAVHGSDGPQTAEQEVRFFFPSH